MKKLPLLALPIDSVLPELLRHLEAETCLVLQAAPGSGKTTRVPAALLDASFRGDREILVLEPRRLAAKLAAARVAEERGESVGQTVGYHFRFENVGGRLTRIRFLTEGMFVRRLLSDPELKNVAAVVVDEFHERHLQGDLALGALTRLQRGPRPDLRVVVMSATIDAAAVANYLGGMQGPARVFSVEGRLHDVKIEYRGDDGARYLEAQVAGAVRHALVEGYDGDVLVFLPGQAEIRRAGEALAELARSERLFVVPLFGDLSREEQERAVRPAERRKIILATNVAETSLTIEGVRIVIDSGLARQASYSYWSGLPALRTKPVSRASAIQRAGRAGRTASGVCMRLYSKQSFESRPPFETAEIGRADLAQTALELKGLGVNDLAAFPWFEPPKQNSLEAAIKQLYRLGALDENERLTALGRRMAEIPAPPRLARLVLEGERRGMSAEACLLAALLQEGRLGDGSLDLMTQFERYRPDFVGAKVRDQLLRFVKKSAAPLEKAAIERELRRAVLAAFPDRVARRRELGASVARRKPGAKTELVLGAGGTALLEDPAGLAGHEYFVAVDVEERSVKAGPQASRILRSVVAVEPEWLFDVEPEGVTEKTETCWDESRGRVDAVTRLMYDSLVLDESPSPADAAAVAELLAKKAFDAGLARFCDEERLRSLLDRVRFVRETLPAPDWPDYQDDATVMSSLVEACVGRRSLAELKEIDFVEALAARLSPEQRQKLDRLAPEFVTLQAGRRVRVHYECGKPPWVESRLQDFFGMKAGPSVLAGRVPVTLHLLAPNMRAVQVTSDLSGFWARVYPDLRRELGRRYPRHKWPEDPL